jgi:hypothetical protein
MSTTSMDKVAGKIHQLEPLVLPYQSRLHDAFEAGITNSG